MVAFTVAVVAGHCPEILVKTLAAEAHLIIERVAAGDHAAPGLGAALPVVHIVLLKGTCRTEGPRSGQPERILDLWGRRLVHVDPRPHLGLVRSAWVPDPEGARGSSKYREI